MKIASILEDLQYNDKKPAIQIMMETETSKEIRILFKKDQVMKEHKTPFPIIVQVFQGSIDFGIQGEQNILKAGSMIALEGGVSHDLKAIEDSVVRLSLSKKDSIERVESVETT
ncbi:cupin domain-containing protein [Nonlabens antarcticus]|uniref:cupin domain-containing protein n=1 Tax=Nonlabens antarcticus TaxID=392714 RepID=UPI001891B42C|nr:cupin domain-containing protein [Nonlabens antarcticus]